MSFVFKYKDEHNDLTCPCPNLKELSSYNGSLFRIVHNDINHRNNFIPVTKISNREFQLCEKHCDGHALSFFATLDKAEKHLTKCLSISPLFIETAGSCISEGIVCQHDGLVSKKSKKGHINLHEFKNTDFRSRFVIVKDLSETEYV